MAVISTFEDRAISGAGVVNRPGFQALMHAAQARLFDVIVIEDLDRLSRDQGDYHVARKRLDFLGITIHSASGKVGKLDGALRALMGEMFIENLATHVRRGLEGVVRDGRHAGGRAFGYKAVLAKPGELEIVADEAETVRRIFADYIAGKTPRAIAEALNARGVQPPRGRFWNASTINGNYGRGGGILLNDLYAGRIVWNKVRMLKDPATGKRISRANPKTQYRIAEAPQLRIVDDVTFRAVQTLKAKRHHEAPPKARAAKRAFSGLIKCGSCGSGMASIGSDAKGLRVQCSAYRESGTCDNSRRVYLEEIEAPVLEAIQQHLEDPKLITEYINAYNFESERLRRDSGHEKARLDRRNRQIERELDRLIDSIAKGVPAETIAPRIQHLEDERFTVRAAIESANKTDGTMVIHPPSVDRYKRDLAELANMLKSGDQERNLGLYASLRELVTMIVVQAKPNVSGVQIDIRGHLAALCDKVTGGPASSGSIEITKFLRQYPKAKSSGGLVVAREGLEPPTPGL